MLLMVVRSSDNGVDSWVSFYGVYDDPVKAEKRMKEVMKRDGNSLFCKLSEDGGWPSYTSEHTQYYLQEIEVNKPMGVF